MEQVPGIDMDVAGAPEVHHEAIFGDMLRHLANGREIFSPDLLQDSGWEALHQGDAIVTQKRRPDDSGSVALVRCVMPDVPYSADVIAAAIKRAHQWQKFNDNLKSATIEKDFGNFRHIVRLQTSLPFPIKDRELLTYNAYHKLPNSGLRMICSLSCRSQQLPVASGHIRAHMIMGGWLLYPHPTDPNRCSIVYGSQSDPRGKIPSAMLNAQLGNRAKLPEKLVARLSSDAALVAQLQQEASSGDSGASPVAEHDHTDAKSAE